MGKLQSCWPPHKYKEKSASMTKQFKFMRNKTMSKQKNLHLAVNHQEWSKPSKNNVDKATELNTPRCWSQNCFPSAIFLAVKLL